MQKCVRVGRTCPDRDTFVRDRDLEFDMKIHESLMQNEWFYSTCKEQKNHAWEGRGCGPAAGGHNVIEISFKPLWGWAPRFQMRCTVHLRSSGHIVSACMLHQCKEAAVNIWVREIKLAVVTQTSEWKRASDGKMGMKRAREGWHTKWKPSPCNSYSLCDFLMCSKQ